MLQLGEYDNVALIGHQLQFRCCLDHCYMGEVHQCI